MSVAFRITDHPNLNGDQSESSFDMKAALNANKLKRHAGLRFRPTDDLRSHLKLDRNAGTVSIYHHTAFLKEHLRLTKDQPCDLAIKDYLKL